MKRSEQTKIITVGDRVTVKGVNRLYGVATVTAVNLPWFSVRWTASDGRQFGGDYTYDELAVVE